MLAYWTIVFGVWGVIGATGLFVDQASQLPA